MLSAVFREWGEGLIVSWVLLTQSCLRQVLHIGLHPSSEANSGNIL